jgi:glutamate-1-semialdehyde 2,1-aminomutase
MGDQVRKGFQEICDSFGMRTYTTGFGSIFVTYFMVPPVDSYVDLLRNDKDAFVELRRKLLEHGVFMLPMNLKRNNVSASHSKDDIEKTLRAARQCLGELSKPATAPER